MIRRYLRNTFAFRIQSLVFLPVIIAALFVSPSYSADPDYYSHKRKGAISGADVVAYYSLEPDEKAVMGRDEFTYQWGGTLWKFSTKENREKFVSEPLKYLPQYGGYCAFAVGHNFTTSIRPNSWTIVDGKLYLNHNNTSQKKFRAKLDESIARADKNWPDVLDRCDEVGRCSKPFTLN